jgi:multicomponent Na+:H+ antiporter subunit A
VILLVLALPFLGTLAVPVLYRLLGERTAYAAAAIALACLCLLGTQLGRTGVVELAWIPSYGVEFAFYVDGLALLIGFLASGVGVLVFAYSGGYMHDEPGKPRYYATLLAFMGSMLGVAFAADLVSLFVFWELTSVTSFLLIGHYRDSAGQYAARKSMLVTVAGGLFMLVGFVVLHVVSGDVLGAATWRLVGGEASLIGHAEEMRAALGEAGLLIPVLLLVGVGIASKSAQVPLHVWLPNAMEAPTPVSAFLHSATMVKAGVYLAGRLRPLLASGEWTLLFVLLGLVTMTVTAVLAVGASDVKELLAYSTASHLGLIVAGFGVAEVVGAETGAFHVVNHALFKAALFLVAGIVAHEAGTRALAELGGLRHELPLTAGITAVAALGMAGVPPFNGFYSKELLFEATYEAATAHGGGLWWALPVLAVLGSVFTFLYSIRFLMLFFGEKPASLGAVHRPPLSMLVPPLTLAGLAGLVGLGGVTATLGLPLAPLESFVGDVVAAVGGGLEHGEGEAFHYAVPTYVSPAVLMSAATIGMGVVLYPFYDRLKRGVRALHAVRPTSPDWYYDAATDRLDHTRAVGVVQNGRLRTYAIWLLLGVCALGLGGYVAAGVEVPAVLSVGLSPAIAIVLLVAVVGALAVAIAPSHVAGVLTLSIVGFMVAIFYILANAPDLALTQLVVETLVLVIFLLVLDKLPAFYGSIQRGAAARDALVAGIVGVTVTVTVLISTARSPASPVWRFFADNAPVPHEHGNVLVDAGGGGNIVNVILVDFRAFDTLGEISVVAMAALAVVTLVAMRGRGETQ